MIERELTYLAKCLPEGLENCKYKEVVDIYIPKDSDHTQLRIRKNGTKYEITKKEPINEDDYGTLKEYTIALTEEEYKILATVEGKMVHKMRYY